MPVSKETAAWGMRMLLGMEPPDDATIDFHRNGYETLEALRASFLKTPQARQLFETANGPIGQTQTDNAAPPQSYRIEPFLLRRPKSSLVPWQFEEPSLRWTVSQLCTAGQMNEDAYGDLCRRLGMEVNAYHRKHWEFAYILAALEQRNLVASGRRGLGFGTGREPLSSVFAKAGVAVMATDAPASSSNNELWANSAQWSHCPEDLWHGNLVDRETFQKLVTFRPVDMNQIPHDLQDFDFCWSACCLEHLGSIRRGLDFLRRCLETLKPGGVAVHTTEFNLSSNDETLETPNLVLFRKQDIESTMEELSRDGHQVSPLNLWPGTAAQDEYVDAPPYGLPHLKLTFGPHQITSVGIIIKKAV